MTDAFRGDEPTILWETPEGVRCLASSHNDGTIEILIMLAAAVLERATFTSDADAAAYAAAAQQSAADFAVEEQLKF